MARTLPELEEIARGNIERHLGDVCTGDETSDAIFTEAYVLGFDALVDAGVDIATAQRVARAVAQAMAQP